MQVDLYDSGIKRRVDRQIGQITTRGYTIDKRYADFKAMRPYFRTDEEFYAYKAKLESTLRYGRHYSRIGKAREDSLFEIEALNIAYNSKSYALIGDYSDALDYVLHRMFRCKMRDIRGIQDYHKISSAMLNYKIDKIGDIPFARLLNSSDELQSAFANYASNSKKHSNILDDSERGIWVTYQFYTEMLSLLSTVKFYVTSVICDQFLKSTVQKGIVRSTSYGKVMATVPGEFNEEVVIHSITDDDIEDYRITYKTYRPFEYLGEVLIRDEFSERSSS